MNQMASRGDRRTFHVKSSRKLNRPIRQRHSENHRPVRDRFEIVTNVSATRRRKNNGDRGSVEAVYYENRTMCRRS